MASLGLLDKTADDAGLPVANTVVAATADGQSQSRLARLRAKLSLPLPTTSRGLVITSVIAQAMPLLLIALIFVAGTWLSFALQRNHHLSPSDWDRLYQLVGQKVLRPRNWSYFTLVLAFALLELGMMVWSQYRRGSHRAPARAFYRLYILIHTLSALLNIGMLVYIVDGGIKVIQEHIMGPENFLKSWL